MNGIRIFIKKTNILISYVLLAFWLMSFLFFTVIPRSVMFKILESPLPLIISVLASMRAVYNFIMIRRRGSGAIEGSDPNDFLLHYASQVMLYTGVLMATLCFVSLFVPLQEIVKAHVRSRFLWDALNSFISMADNGMQMITGLASSAMTDFSNWLLNKADRVVLGEKYLAQIKDKAKQDYYKERLDYNQNVFTHESEGSIFVALTMKGFDEGSTLGSIMRLIEGKTDIVKEEGSLTRAFLDKTASFAGSEGDVIKNIYKEITNSISFVDNKAETGLFRDSEAVLSRGKGVCREQAALLNAALQNHNIRSKVVGNSTHAWVEVNSKDDGVYWLDPTNFKDFLPMVPVY
ncbi:transglutaminase-like domain-containing protein [Candidatus Margulisiibacteriota bacterium]